MEKAVDRTGRSFAALLNIVLNKHLSSLCDCFYVISVVCCGVHVCLTLVYTSKSVKLINVLYFTQ